MNKSVLLAASAVLALTAGGAVAHPTLGVMNAHIVPIKHAGKTLYSQNSNFASLSIVSQNFSSTYSNTYDAAGADDFLVPKGKTWKISGLDAPGVYFNGSGPAQSVAVTFYKDSKGKPGKAVGKTQNVSCTDSAGSFSCKIKATLDNTAGKKSARYWVSVVANLNYSPGGEWGWTQIAADKNDPGKWENPGGGFGTSCSSWTNTSSCIPTATSNDFAFDLTSGK